MSCHPEDILVTNLMKNAAYEQVSHLHDYQTSAIIGIMRDKAPSLLSSPSAIKLFAHVIGSEEFGYGSQRKVEVVPEEFPKDVLYFLSNAYISTIYKDPDAGLAYRRLYAYAELAYLDYEKCRYPLARREGDDIADRAHMILQDKGFTNSRGQMNLELKNLLRPGMNKVFRSRYFLQEQNPSLSDVKNKVERELNEKYTFKDERS